jgi:hypothetical protein
VLPWDAQLINLVVGPYNVNYMTNWSTICFGVMECSEMTCGACVDVRDLKKLLQCNIDSMQVACYPGPVRDVMRAIFTCAYVS